MENVTERLLHKDRKMKENEAGIVVSACASKGLMEKKLPVGPLGNFWPL